MSMLIPLPTTERARSNPASVKRTKRDIITNKANTVFLIIMTPFFIKLDTGDLKKEKSPLINGDFQYSMVETLKFLLVLHIVLLLEVSFD